MAIKMRDASRLGEATIRFQHALLFSDHARELFDCGGLALNLVLRSGV
jgi:hypothetical protein